MVTSLIVSFIAGGGGEVGWFGSAGAHVQLLSVGLELVGGRRRRIVHPTTTTTTTTIVRRVE